QASYFQLDMFRETCMTSVINVLTRLSKDPAMLFWLDNNENHREEINENYGRELLELFSMGVGNYTEADIKSASRAFTGWTFTTNVPGKIYPSRFVFRADDHDDGVKTFMGHTGRLNGEDIVEIISRQPATARFFARHLYTFFVADEPPVSSWNEIPPGNPAAIDTLVKAYMDSVGDLRHILRVLFTSDFFKNSLFLRVKSPAEMVVGVIKMLDDYKLPAPQFAHYGTEAGKMGQRLMNPNTVEGWITGSGWIDGGTLNNRVNFAVNEVSDPTKPAIQALALALAAHRRPVPPPDLVEGCLDFAGPLPVSHQTRAGLLRHAETQGSARPDPEELANRISDLLRLIVATREYQFG
ncbi:MAG: DUF1800 domain-containing protein, partial [SAR202 cluster bacterium]|nr:DUF1800 domain-containing protein [SAR202 cluster bacterium]